MQEHDRTGSEADRSGRMVWVDLEMTGLDPEKERIIELAVLVTEADLTLVAEGPELVLHQSEELLAGMDEWNTKQHTGSGLVARVRESTVTEHQAETEVLKFLRRHCAAKTSPLAGNSVHHDRRFLSRYMPRIADFLHYRIVDVSTIKELARRWHPEVVASLPPKPDSHRALDDIRASVEELSHYRRTFFRAPEDEAVRRDG